MVTETCLAFFAVLSTGPVCVLPTTAGTTATVALLLLLLLQMSSPATIREQPSTTDYHGHDNTVRVLPCCTL